MTKVLLLRNSNSENDPYHEELMKNGFVPSSIPVLSFEFINLEELSQILKQPESFSGLILTSQRAVEAIKKCIDESISSQEWETGLSSKWKSLLVFAIGGATMKTACNLGFNCLGSEAGCAEDLVPVIQQYISSGDKPLVFLCGNLSKETIPDSLHKAGISLQALTVYSTVPHPDLKMSLQDYISKEGAPKSIVFFSPSGVEFIYDHLCEVFSDPMVVQSVAIGKTTAKALTERQMALAGISERPNPKSLSQCLVEVLSE